MEIECDFGIKNLTALINKVSMLIRSEVVFLY